MTPIDSITLARVPDEHAALEHLRLQIRALAPQATEAISYGMPAFRRRALLRGPGRDEAGRSSTSAASVQTHGDELAGYRVWKGTVNFAPDMPLPAEWSRSGPIPPRRVGIDLAGRSMSGLQRPRRRQ